MPPPRISVTVDGAALPTGVAAALSTLEVHEGDDLAGRARLGFALRQTVDGTYPLIDGGPFEPGAEIRIDLAAPGGSAQAVFAGVVSHVRPHFEEIEANCHVEVVATDHTMVLATHDRVASYPDASDSDVATEIIGRYGLRSDVEESAARLAADDILLLQRGDDWTFLRHLATRNGFTTYVEPDPVSGDPVVHFHAPRLSDDPQADLTILREQDNLAWVDFQLAYDRPATRRMVAVDAVGKRLVRSDADSDDPTLGEALVAVAAADGLTRAGATGVEGHLRGALPRDVALNAHVAGRTARDHMAIEARGAVDAARYRALLRAHRPVLIKGVGDRLAGAYYITEVVTTLEDEVLRQRFVAVSNALGRAGDERFGRTADEEGPR